MQEGKSTGEALGRQVLDVGYELVQPLDKVVALKRLTHVIQWVFDDQVAIKRRVSREPRVLARKALNSLRT